MNLSLAPLLVVLLPLVISSGAVFLFTRGAHLTLLLVGLFVPYILTYLGFLGLPDFPPGQSSDTWIYLYAIFFVGIAYFIYFPNNRLNRWLVIHILVSIGAALLLKNRLWGAYDDYIAFALCIAIGFAGSCLYSLWELSLAKYSDFVFTLFVAGLLGFSGIAVLATGSLQIGVLGASLFFSAAPFVWLVHIKRVNLPIRILLLSAGFLGAFFHLLGGAVFSELPWTSAAVFMLAPLAGGLYRPFQDSAPWRASIIQGTLVLVPLLVAFALAIVSGMPALN